MAAYAEAWGAGGGRGGADGHTNGMPGLNLFLKAPLNCFVFIELVLLK